MNVESAEKVETANSKVEIEQEATLKEEVDTMINEVLDFEIDKSFLLGKINQYSDSRFEEMPISAATRENIFVLKEVVEAFSSMQEAAKAEAVNLKVLSGARNFSEQKRIWERKWNGQKLVENQNLKEVILDPVLRAKKIMEYSSMPGTSRHHWGTDIDINNLSSNYFKSGKGKQEYDWLVKNASKFGFCQTYTSKDAGRTGYNEEEWHWTYTPISSILTAKYAQTINYTDINGFDGSEAAQALKAIENYVLGLNPTCK